MLLAFRKYISFVGILLLFRFTSIVAGSGAIVGVVVVVVFSLEFIIHCGFNPQAAIKQKGKLVKNRKLIQWNYNNSKSDTYSQTVTDSSEQPSPGAWRGDEVHEYPKQL